MHRGLETDGVPAPSEFEFETWDRRALELRMAEACRTVGRLEDERDALTAEVERLRGALEQYADKKNWEDVIDEYGCDWQGWSNQFNDGYKIALAALTPPTCDCGKGE